MGVGSGRSGMVFFGDGVAGVEERSRMSDSTRERRSESLGSSLPARLNRPKRRRVGAGKAATRARRAARGRRGRCSGRRADDETWTVRREREGEGRAGSGRALRHAPATAAMSATAVASAEDPEEGAVLTARTTTGAGRPARRAQGTDRSAATGAAAKARWDIAAGRASRRGGERAKK